MMHRSPSPIAPVGVPPVRILLVEDDPLLSDSTARALRSQGWVVDCTERGEPVAVSVRQDPYDLLILDVGLAGIDGFETLRRVRAQGSDLPVLMLTARDAIEDRVRGLESGADDYIVKPFNPKELVARIKTRLRPTSHAATGTINVGDLTLDVAGHEVRRSDEQINLTPLEFELLLALALKPQQVFTREMLLEQVWGYHYKADTRLVNVHVQRLRAKVEVDPDNPRIVMTVRGVGYRAGSAS
jgi:two-component system, OmpR family, response regulator MtrA